MSGNRRMKIYRYPKRQDWPEICRRPDRNSGEIARTVTAVMHEVRTRGDAALEEFTKRFDGCDADILVQRHELVSAANAVPPEVKKAIETAGRNIHKFHAAQEPSRLEIETFPGVVCGTRQTPIERVGIYAPGGTAPLFSSLMMLAIPAKLAGCSEIVVCSPPGKDGNIDPVVLYAANLFGATKILRVGGAQAVAAMAYGTESVPKVDKIFGPGNRYVTEAKMQAAGEGVAIDMPAGPSEVAIIADRTSDPVFLAADLLAQAEHGTDSQVVLIADTEVITAAVLKEIELQIGDLPRKEIASAALANSFSVILSDAAEAVDFANVYASEHLIVATADADRVADGVTNAGSIFIGKYSCESAGDYASGTNHTLPTNGFARSYSGVSLASFRKQITYQRITREGILGLGPVIETLAEAEGLMAHKNAVTVRLNDARRASGGTGNAS